MTSSPLLLILNSVMCSNLLKSSFLELEIAPWLRALDDLPEDLGSTPSTHNAVYNYNSSSGRSDALFCPLREPGTQVVQIYLGKIPIYKTITTTKKPLHVYQNKLLLYYSKTHSTQFPVCNQGKATPVGLYQKAEDCVGFITNFRFIF